MYSDPSGCIAGVDDLIFWGIIALIAIIGTTAVVVETQTQAISNTIISLGNAASNAVSNAINDVSMWLVNGTIGLILQSLGSKAILDYGNIGSSNNNFIYTPLIGSSFIYSTLDLGVVFPYQRKKAAPRIKNNTKKRARKKAFHKGGKTPPVHHPNGKHGPHYHPADPRFSHWHYYYNWVLWLLDKFIEDNIGDDN